MDTRIPEWSLPPGVHALQTLRGDAREASSRAGASRRSAYRAFNLATHVGDAADRVADDRRRLGATIGEPWIPWLEQVHGVDVLVADRDTPVGCRADAVITTVPGVACAVLTADCLPVLLASDDGRVVAAVHAGWRGLCAGVLEAAVAAVCLRCDSSATVSAWMGPAIGPDAFEVGPEVRDAFVARDRQVAAAFRQGRGDRWHADLFALARHRLGRVGVDSVVGGADCTFSQPERYFSYRRDGITGRQASLIWISG